VFTTENLGRKLKKGLLLHSDITSGAVDINFDVNLSTITKKGPAVVLFVSTSPLLSLWLSNTGNVGLPTTKHPLHGFFFWKESPTFQNFRTGLG
jgi:hypothetical protein